MFNHLDIFQRLKINMKNKNSSLNFNNLYKTHPSHDRYSSEEARRSRRDTKLKLKYFIDGIDNLDESYLPNSWDHGKI